MSTYEVRSLAELVRLIERHGKERTKKVLTAVKKAAARGRAHVKQNVPVAHGEVRESVHTEGAFIIVDAPHAAAVNNGSRPHTPPLEPLVEWVKLRGMQGLLTERQRGRLPGTTTKGAAEGVAAMLRAREIRGPGGYSPVDAAVQVARMIQRAIAKHGTKPHHFIEKSLPELRRILGEELRNALGQTPSGGGGVEPGGGGSTKTTKSGAYRKNVGTYRGAQIQTDASGQKFAVLKNGKTVFLKH